MPGPVPPPVPVPETAPVPVPRTPVTPDRAPTLTWPDPTRTAPVYTPTVSTTSPARTIVIILLTIVAIIAVVIFTRNSGGQSSSSSGSTSPTAAPAAITPTGSATTTSGQEQQNWSSIKDSPSSPLYAIPVSLKANADGSYLLISDPLSPDVKGTSGAGCDAWYFSDPSGTFCLVNATVRNRKVTIWPTAVATVGDNTSTMPDLQSFVGSDPCLLALTLDSQGYVTQILAIPLSSDSAGTGSNSGTNQGSNQGSNQGTGTSQQQMVTVPDVRGMGNIDAERTLQSAGLQRREQTTNTDPSNAARTNNACPIIDQDPQGGTPVEQGSTVTILLDCPMTGQY